MCLPVCDLGFFDETNKKRSAFFSLEEVFQELDVLCSFQDKVALTNEREKRRFMRGKPSKRKP